jgi:hypothetical protein
MKTLSLLISCVALALLAGCSSPAKRIHQNPEAFNSLSPGDQQLIREGKVAIGFTPEMVRLALGDPDRVLTRTDANGVSESWSYTTYETDDGVMLYHGYYHRYWSSPYYYPYYPYYGSYSGYRTREYFKVVFVGGRVASIESQT